MGASDLLSKRTGNRVQVAAGAEAVISGPCACCMCFGIHTHAAGSEAGPRVGGMQPVMKLGSQLGVPRPRALPT